MDILTGCLVILALVGLMLGSAYISGRSAMNAKKEMQCVACDTQETYVQVCDAFTEANIPHSNMSWTPGSGAFTLWVPNSNANKAKELLLKKFQVKITPTVFLVST